MDEECPHKSNTLSPNSIKCCVSQLQELLAQQGLYIVKDDNFADGGKNISSDRSSIKSVKQMSNIKQDAAPVSTNDQDSANRGESRKPSASSENVSYVDDVADTALGAIISTVERHMQAAKDGILSISKDIDESQQVNPADNVNSRSSVEQTEDDASYADATYTVSKKNSTTKHTTGHSIINSDDRSVNDRIENFLPRKAKKVRRKTQTSPTLFTNMTLNDLMLMGEGPNIQPKSKDTCNSVNETLLEQVISLFLVLFITVTALMRHYWNR